MTLTLLLLAIALATIFVVFSREVEHEIDSTVS